MLAACCVTRDRLPKRHRARVLHELRVRLAVRFAELAAAITLNHHLGRPSRSLARYAY
jgi:hypothetical protein